MWWKDANKRVRVVLVLASTAVAGLLLQWSATAAFDATPVKVQYNTTAVNMPPRMSLFLGGFGSIFTVVGLTLLAGSVRHYRRYQQLLDTEGVSTAHARILRKWLERGTSEHSSRVSCRVAEIGRAHV